MRDKNLYVTILGIRSPWHVIDAVLKASGADRKDKLELSVVARLGDKTFRVGSGTTIVAPTSGTLYLGVDSHAFTGGDFPLD